MMETHEGKTVPIVKEFQIQGSWTPVTPVKPILPRPRLIYEDGQGGVIGQAYMRESEDYLSRFSHQNQAHTLLSCSISSAGRGNPYNSNTINSHNNNNDNTTIWDDPHGSTTPLPGRINSQRENGESQRRGLEDYLPHWSSQGKRRMPSSFGTGNPVPSNYPSFSSWESPLSWKNNGLRENVSILQHNNSHDPLAPFDNLSFGELLAANGSALEPSVISSSQGDTGGAPRGSIYSGWNTQPQDSRFDSSAMYRNQDSFPGLNQQINGICVQEMHGAFPHQLWSNINSPPSTKHANGKNSTFAPPTPDLQSRAESNVASGNAIPGPNQRPDEQNGLQEHEAAAAMINLHDLNHKDVTEPTTDSSLGKVSAIVEENQHPEKEADQIIDLNKTPQKKPRRKRYMPKVVNENKPKRTPKPKTPKPTDAKENPKPKRKYVRKNKSTPSTTSPEGTTEPNDPKPTEPKAKSCKKSLNFDLNGQVPEHNSVPMSKDGSCADPNDSHVAGNQSSNTVDLRQGEELMIKSSQVGIAYDLNCSLSQELRNYISLPEKVNLDDSQPDHTVPTEGNEKATSSSLGPNAEVPSRADACLAQSPNSSPCTSSNEAVQARGSKRGYSSVHDTTDVDAGNSAANSGKSWHTNDTFLVDGNTKGVPTFPFPGIHKKKRTEKGQRSHTSSTSSSAMASEDFSQAANIHIHPRVDSAASKYYYCNPASYGNNLVTNSQVQLLMRSEENRAQLLNTWVDIARLKKKKRTKGVTRVRDLAPLKGIASVSPAKPAIKRPGRRKNDTLNKPYPGTGNINLSNGVHSCMEALSEDTHGTPRSKRRYRKQNSAINSRTYKVNQPLELVLYDGNQAMRNTTVPVSVLPWVNVSVEAITEGMKRLDINRKGRKISRQEQKALVPYNVNNQAQNAIVPYENNGTIVPFEPTRRQRQRAKVDLDDETTRVWRLLLENIDNKGIDGTDEEKAKWWENERSVFQGRVDSFIARMRLVQGDRRFTPWKGSVLDSVIGVFLTQNVSDHLSSSAFMSLAARFPLKLESTESTLSEEASSALVAEPNYCIIDAEESITWIEKPLDQPTCDMDSRIIPEIEHSEEREVVNSKEMIGGAPGSVSPVDYSSESSQKAPIEIRVHKANSQTTETEAASTVGDDRARDDASSSQQSVISSQNSVNSPNLQTKGMVGTFSENNSTAQNSSNCNYYHCSSFTGLLKMAEAPFHYGLMGQLQCMNHVVKDSPEAPSIFVNDYQLHLKTDFHLQGTRCSELLDVERSSNTSRKDENSTTEISNLSTESTVHLVMDKSSDGIQRPFAENVSSCYVLEGENMVIQSEGQSMKEIQVNVSSSAQAQTSSIWGRPNLLKSLQHNDDVTESTTALGRKNNELKETGQKSGHNHVSDGVSDITNVDPSKPKKGRAGKEKRNPYNWDNLRKEAQVNGIKRERTANTRDSLDWEAVRHANVHEVADTIKERGMNNMLAERIKDLLDRLVKDHGSVDMEWLRDIPPDKAKEYLLSFRGLGLKSVECVRLLTLHHLAFPVDTNVGRIAVRLGWVPLQPLPESLQLHLLELYPVLESIQKYLWPRLCKLDQKTLYELHYHMITFGKVFCTKRQPNCNACPLRGECRHFASAFASARLALPGLEERSIMPSAGSNSAHLHPQANINPLPLPPSWSNQHQNTNFGSNQHPPMIEVPSSPLSLPLPQTIHHLQRPSQINCEPIVEVPASPEPEPEQEHTLGDIEDTFYEDPDEIPTIKLNMKQFTQTLQNFMQANKELQETGMSRALVALTPDAASIPTPKLKNISRLRTEHHVYELPDTHPLLKNLDKREPDDPCSYLLAIWTPGETADSIQPPERRCNFEDPGIFCNEETCSYCSSQREANSQIVRATLLIPCRTAMRGSFPLNGTYFQVNEVFADHESSLNPLHVSRELLWNLPRRTVYFGTSIPTIFRGLTTEDIQHCFWRGYVCVRGFDQKTRAPRPLMARLHFPASRMPRGTKGKPNDE